MDHGVENGIIIKLEWTYDSQNLTELGIFKNLYINLLS